MDNFFENLEKVIHMLDFSTKLSSIPLAIHIRQITILLKRKKLSPKEKAIRENTPSDSFYYISERFSRSIAKSSSTTLHSSLASLPNNTGFNASSPEPSASGTRER